MEPGESSDVKREKFPTWDIYVYKKAENTKGKPNIALFPALFLPQEPPGTLVWLIFISAWTALYVLFYYRN